LVRNKYLYIIILFFNLLIKIDPIFGESTADSLLLVLKSEIKNKDNYDRIKEARIQKLKSKYSLSQNLPLSERYKITESLLDEYIVYKRDSAIVLANKLISLASQTNDPTKMNGARIKLGQILISSGAFKEASNCLDSINITNDSNHNKYEYYHLLYWLNWALQFSLDDTYYSPNYRIKEIAYRDSAKVYANPSTYDLELLHLFPDSVYTHKDTNYKYYMNFLNAYQQENPLRAARLAFMYNFIYEGDERANHFLLLAAIFDVRNSTKETAAILKLGENFYKKGNINDAYFVLQEGLDNANFFGSKLHKLEITSILPQVTAQKILNTERKIMTFVIVSSFLIFIIIWFFYSRTKLKSLNQKISSKNTELQNLLLELERSQRENSWILKVLAHDLRGAIAGSINLCEILIHNPHLSSDEKKMLELMDESNKDALITISDLLNIKTDRDALVKSETVLDKLILESVTLLQYKANEKSQLLKTNLTPINIAINKEKIRRVLDNILNNAIKFSSRNSNIEIMLLDKDQHTIQIRIADNGIGIPEEFRSKLFDLNPNIRREGTLGEESFGLGLYICKQIIDQHKGKIWIENNADQGTIFIIELPKS
jgi:signal transduction histidine kinase